MALLCHSIGDPLRAPLEWHPATQTAFRVWCATLKAPVIHRR